MRIDLAGWTREATQAPPREFFALFERAEALGFDGVWFSEFRVPDAGWPYPSPLLLASALLARTERLRVGTSVLVLPLHHPLMLAEEIAQVDYQSQGRIDVGVGRGTDPASLQALEIDPAATRQRFETSCRLIRASLRGEVVASNEGPWRFAPRQPVATPAPRTPVPMYVAGSTHETLGFALAEDLPLLLSLEPCETAQLQRLEHVAQECGQATSSVRARSSLARYVCIGATDADVQAQLDALWGQLYQRRVHFAGKRGVAPGDVPPIQIEQVLHEQFIYGTPDACHAQLKALTDRMGIEQIRCVFNANGLWSNVQALAGMELFAREVMPALRRLTPPCAASAEAPAPKP
ncbi:MAG: LLM class flavin-dependent oxidoreductase [Comamonadaceae bacterium]|nr:MAG: LLM class flavin-dependent oxidoreductase [Comamonadaceae bacterium]